MSLVSIFLVILQRPTISDALRDLMIFIAPLWIASVLGILIGWSWKPKWANFGEHKFCSSDSKNSTAPPSFSVSFPGLIPSWNSLNFQLPSCISWISDDPIEKRDPSVSPSTTAESSLSDPEPKNSTLVSEEELEHLCRLLEEKDEGPEWIHMMDRCTSTMSYQAWRRDPQTGPPQYRSRTVFEEATPEMVRDFFWDDDFRLKWDDMLIDATTLQECPTTGTMVVRWVRKFPFFCSDREYVIGRRIWESGRSYYCVTKGVPRSFVLEHNKPRRVDLYYSSWCIRAVESRKGDSQLTACEIILFHYEDMGIPRAIAKLGIKQGMWEAVKKFDPSLRAYQKERTSGAPLPHCAFMARINTKVSADYLRCLEIATDDLSEDKGIESSEEQAGKNISKLLVIGGAVILACGLNHGFITKAIILGVARRLGK